MKDILIGIFTGLIMVIFVSAMVTEAKTTGIISMDEEGRIYSTQTGYFTVQGKTYYAHHSKSAMYDKGELATRTYRVRNGKMYYFDKDGVMVKKKSSRNRTTRYIDFNRDGSVHYIFPAGYGEPRERYNANRRRFQVRKNGKWVDEGMQCWPFGWIDWQW